MVQTSIKLYYQVFPLVDSAGKEAGEIARPIVQILLNYKHGRMFGPVRTLLDSGADYNLFPAEVAEILGINLKKGLVKITEGIGGKRIATYRHFGIKMFVEGYSFETSIDLSKDIGVPLLGQQGFFDKFNKISFERKSEIIKLEF